MTYHPYIQPEFHENGCQAVLEHGKVCRKPPEHPDHDPVMCDKQNVTPKVDKNSKPTI